ncbi:MAG TPA: hypothetical protein VD927_14295 [Chryseosolibacter sp.]|nr:hypothetical protein [Chryseosolibacter sp.]
MRKTLYGLLIFIGLLGTVYACMNMVWSDMCENQIIEETQSPSKQFKTIIFTRDCGATTGHSTQLSIIKATDQLGNEAGNVFILTDKFEDGVRFENGGAKVKAVWTGDDALTIYYDSKIEFTKKLKQVKDVKITYRPLAA